MAAARSVRRLRSAESANSRSTALRDVPRRVASASTSLRRSSGIDTMTFAMPGVYRGIRLTPETPVPPSAFAALRRRPHKV
jgi:CRP-like cAMP-binding protein